MKRRQFITLIGGAAAWPLAARAQQPAMPVIGWLSARSSESEGFMLDAFRQGLKDGGYIEGRNLAIEYRWADGQYERLPALAADLARRRIAVLVSVGGTIVVPIARAAAGGIPIVFNVGNDPVANGLVASFNRPGGNLTGVYSLRGSLAAKELGLLHQLAPKAVTIAVLVNPSDTVSTNVQWDDASEAAPALGLRLRKLSTATPDEIDAAFASLSREPADAMLVTTSPFFATRIAQITALAAQHGLPTLYFRRDFTEAGGLISYGDDVTEGYRQMGVYVGRILMGAKAGDLPVVQPSKFELVINLKTAKALSLTVPPTLLAIADEVIE
jgi:putative tryptophan/tyrosine transport system substrate-binding protein